MATKKKAPAKKKAKPRKAGGAGKATGASRAAYAKHLLDLFKQFKAHLQLDPPLDARTLRSLSPGLKPSDAFLEKCAALWEANGARLGLSTFDAQGLRDSIRYATTMRQVVDGMAMGTALADEKIFRTQAEAGNEALTLYAALKVAVRRKENKDLLPALHELAALSKAGGTRAGAKPRKAKKASSGPKKPATAATMGSTPTTTTTVTTTKT